MAAALFPVSSFIDIRRFSPCKPYKDVKYCKFAIKSMTKVPVPLPEPNVRRSGNHKPSMWDTNFLHSLKTEYTGQVFDTRASELKEEVRILFNNVVEPLDQLELIDQLQRVGLDYHYHDEINRTLKNIHTAGHNNENSEKGLHATALEFRLLRQHGHYTSTEGFKRFTENGSFIKGIRADVQGVLSLYEASYFSMEGEPLMEEAWSFTSNLLKECVENIIDLDLQMQVRQALKLPLQWRIPRFDAKWYINLYQRSGDMIPAVLEFAKLDFNIRQASNQEEFKDLSRWLSRLDMGKKLPFARNRLVGSFCWSLGITGEPQHIYCREVLTKVIELIGVYDDAYDIYGTLDELELFTDFVERWDMNAMQELPDYMKLCFLSLNNFVNETTYDILKDHNIDTLAHQRKSFNELFKRYLVEARWYNSGYQPTLEEYLRNGFVSIAGFIVVLYSYICTADPIKKEDLKFQEDFPDLVRLAYEINRLTDDYGTSSAELKRGDVPSAIHCYMSDTGVSEEVSREHIMNLIRKKWAQVNKLRFSKEDNNPLSWTFVDIMMNLIRVGHCLYNGGEDGYSGEDGVAKATLVSLLVDPIPLSEVSG